MDNRPTVLLIYGGKGYERDVSVAGMENLLPKIDENRYRVLPLFIEPDGRWVMYEKEALLVRGGIITDGEFTKIDCAFPLLHGDFGEDGRVQGALDCACIKYIGCDTVTSALCRDKYIVKAVAKSLEIPTLPCILAIKGEDLDTVVSETREKFGYPVFVKPTSLGSSIGASTASSNEELISALLTAFSVSDRVIIEKCLSPKRELECGYFKAKGKEVFTKCGEILCEGFYSYHKKYSSPEVKTRAVADVGEEISLKIQEYSRRLVRALGIRDIARIDFFLSGEDIYFNEINTMPGQTKASLYAQMLAAAGVPENEFPNMLIEECLTRG